MKPTRQRILDFLRGHHVATAAELGVTLQMSAANVRYHLAILAENGQIEPYEMRKSPGRGRPGRLYRLARRAHNLDRLSRVLLHELLEPLPADARSVILRRLAERLAGSQRPEEPRGASGLAQRLTDAAQLLEALHYEARWEAHAEGPRVILAHCPYHTIIEAHPELCQLDAYLLEYLVREPVQQTAKLVPSSLGLPACAFLVAAGGRTVPTSTPVGR